MYTIKRSQRFKKDFKRMSRRPDFDEDIFLVVVDHLISGVPLPKQYKEHGLQGEFNACMECHLHFDLLLIYQVDHDAQMVYLLRIGSHGELF